MIITPGLIGSVAVKGASYVPPLDGRSDVHMAYSLRWLRSAYTGPAIRVRRSSDNVEQDIGLLSSGGLNTTDLLNFCGGSSGFVIRIYDQSGNARHLQQTVYSQQPRIVNAGVLETRLNGKPCAIFTSASQSCWLSPSNYPIPASASMFFLAGAKTMTTGGSFFQMAVGANRYDVYYNNIGISIVNEIFDNIGTTLNKSGFSSLNANSIWHRFRINHVAKTYYIAHKGATTTTTASASFTKNRDGNTTSAVQVGRRDSSAFLDFDFHEFVVLNADIGSTDFTNLENNIQLFYNV